MAGAVGNSMFAALTSVAGSLYKFGPGRGLPGEVRPRRIAVHADEFNALIGDEFIPLPNKAGGAGFQATAHTQTWWDVEARIGSPAKAGQIAGNFNTLIMLHAYAIVWHASTSSAVLAIRPRWPQPMPWPSNPTPDRPPPAPSTAPTVPDPNSRRLLRRCNGHKVGRFMV